MDLINATTEVLGKPLLEQAKKEQRQKDLFNELIEKGPETGQYSPLQAQYKSVKTPFGTMKVKTGMAMDPRFKLQGPESYIEKALGQQKLEEARALDQGTLAQQQGLAQSGANLAMRGGVTPQQRMQLQKQGMRDLMMQKQDIFGKGAMQRGDIGLEGEKMGREINRYNIEQELGQLGRAQDLEIQQYQTKMAGLAGKEAAKATRQAAAQQSKK